VEDHSVAPSQRSTPKSQSRVTHRKCLAEAIQTRSDPVQPGSGLVLKRPTPEAFLSAKFVEHVKSNLRILQLVTLVFHIKRNVPSLGLTEATMGA